MIEMIIEQWRRDLGSGLGVGRVLPFAKRRMVGPFIFFDHMGPMDLAPGIDHSVDVRAHPHIGLATVTYLFAGSGITHSERFEHARLQGDHLHGIQAWVALLDRIEEIAPSFTHHAGDDLPQSTDAGVTGQLIAGSAYGLTAGTQTHSPLFYAHLEMAPGATAEIPGGHSERALYVAAGAVEMDGSRHEAGRMLILGAAASRVRAFEPSTIMVLGGEPVGERFLYWNFVSSSEDRLAQAAADWKAGRMKLPDADDQEFIPLPDEPAPPTPVMS